VGSIIYNEAADFDAKLLQVDEVYVHLQYGLVAARNVFLKFIDVAILHLRSPIPFTDTIKPICLPTPSVNLQQFKVCVATGFGNTRSDARKSILCRIKKKLDHYNIVILFVSFASLIKYCKNNKNRQTDGIIIIVQFFLISLLNSLKKNKLIYFYLI